MTPEEFAKLMQKRQDDAHALPTPDLQAQRVIASKASQLDSRLIITAVKPTLLDSKFANTIWRERSKSGTVTLVSPTELAVSIQGNRKAYIDLEVFLARIFAHAAVKGAKHFQAQGQWGKFSSKTGMFTKEQVTAKDFNLLE